MCKMKKIYKFCIGALLGTIIVSCVDQLDSDKNFKDRMTLEDVFTNEKYSEEWLAHAYSYLKGENMDVGTKDNILWCFADDIYFGDRDIYNTFKTGTYSEGDRQSWGASYKGIRQASIFIQNIDMNMEFTEAERADLKAQARFVRAYYYWLLLRKYGPVPLLPEEGLDYTASYDDLACQRNSYDECVEYIESEMRLAAKDLPLDRGANHTSRPTRGAALAARAKVLLYAASPINNPRPEDTERFTDLVDHDGRCLLAQEYNEYKWAKAAAAARDVMELPGSNYGHRYVLHTVKKRDEAAAGYPKTLPPYSDNDFENADWPNGYRDIDPFESYRQVFNGALSMFDNPELIFSRGQNQGDRNLADMVLHQLPTSANGWNTHGMTQKMCDAYYMYNGSEFNRQTFLDTCQVENRFVSEKEGKAGTYPYLKKGVWKEYAWREPRFYASVAFNGCVWPLLNNSTLKDPKPVEQQVFYYRGNGNGYTNSNFWLRTGIGIMKFVHPDDTSEAKGNKDYVKLKTEPAIRFAEILLIYAEALNELEEGSSYDIPSWDGSASYSVKRDINEMKKGIRPVRCRAGVPDYTLPEYQDRNVFRKKLKHERQIELMGEGHRYFDLRRWKDAPIEESMEIYGCDALMTEENRAAFHSPIVVNELPTAFSRKLYFWPISHEELKRNKLLTQNPGWTYND